MKLQELALKQWINIGDWTAELNKHRSQFIIGFHVINPTQLPVTLHAVLVKTKGASDIERQDIGVADMLAPDNPYIATVVVSLTEEETTHFVDARGINISFECDVLFADSRGEHWQQTFKRMIYVSSEVMESKKPVTPYVMEVRNLLRRSSFPSTN